MQESKIGICPTGWKPSTNLPQGRGTIFALYQVTRDEKFHARQGGAIEPEKDFIKKEDKTMLWTIIALLVVLWLLGLLGGLGGNLIHLLLVIAAVVLIFQLISGRRITV